jgi:hypothetical protein
MLSKQAAGLTDAERQQKATAYFNALFNRTEVSNIAITPVYTTTDSTQLVITGTGKVPATIAKIMGIQQLNIGVSSTIRWGSSRLCVALVLDNTGSMASSNKMTALKTASKSLLDQLRSAATQRATSMSRSFRSTKMSTLTKPTSVSPGSGGISGMSPMAAVAATQTPSPAAFATKAHCGKYSASAGPMEEAAAHRHPASATRARFGTGTAPLWSTVEVA